MTKMLKISAAIAALSLSIGAQAAPVTIDTFNTDQNLIVDSTTADGGLWSQVSGAGILGGHRDLFVELNSKGGNVNGVAEIGVGGGWLSFSTSSLTTGNAIIRWDGANAGPAIDPLGLGGVSFGNPFSTNLSLTTIFSDQFFPFALEVYSSANQWSRVTLVSNDHQVPTTTSIPLSAFLDCGFNAGGIAVTCGGGGAVDFSNVGAVQALINLPAAENGVPQLRALDLTLDEVNLVPEPTSLALVGMGLLGALASTRRRK